VDPDQWRRVNAMLQDALARPADERAAFLDQACRSRPDDRREVESLLSHHDEGSDFLERGPGELAAALMMLPSSALAVGRRLGPYTIIKELGRGGMGTVYLARDTRLDRLVALKVLSPEVSQDARQRERLKQEARASASVSHPGVAHVYALEETEDGIQYIASEYVAGRTLRQEIDEGPLTPELVVSTALGIAKAAAAAHDRGIAHRDLKPENVMRAEDGTVKVLDFGLARTPAAATEQAQGRLTVPGSMIGTPEYMSPEQLRGSEIGFATDVFSLGLMIHEMAVGAHPFGGSGPPPMLVRILEEKPNAVPPDVRAALPGLEAIVWRCLQKDPVQRYASMEELVADLDRIDLELPVEGVSRVTGSLEPTVSTRFRAPLPQSQWWWRFHQLAISLLYVGVAYPVWTVRAGPRPVYGVLFLALVAAAALATTMRLHLVFTSIVHPGRLASERHRSHVWIRLADWLMSLLLLVAAGVALVGERLWIGAVLATVAACGTVAFLLIEPATTDAAFPSEG